MADDSEDPNAWWATRKDLSDAFYDTTGHSTAKQISKQKWVSNLILAAVFFLVLALSVWFDSHPLPHWISKLVLR
jgi:hypothetical protein